MVACQNSQSQFGEERALFDTVLGRRTKGTYVEIGAHDGLRFSNTLMLHTWLVWCPRRGRSGPCVAAEAQCRSAETIGVCLRWCSLLAAKRNRDLPEGGEH